MAINTHQITLAATPQTTYNSINQTAVMYMSICNHGGATATVDVHVVPNSDSATTENMILSSLQITANDSYIALPSGERLIMENGDQIIVTSDVTTVSIVTSYVAM